MSAAQAQISAQAPLAVGQRVMWYEVEEVLSSDAYGITYRARNVQAEGRSDGQSQGEHAPVVAIRELLPHELAVRGDFSEVRVADPAQAALFADARARFVSEANTLATLNHPAIVRVHFHRRINATAYMVMEYLSGRSLRHALEERPTLTEAQLLAWFDPVLDGLGEVHRRGLLHANLSPQSVWVRDDDRLVLTGFGGAQLAYLRALREPLSGLAPGYAAVEQYADDAGGHQGPWTDVYGLAAVMYRVVTGYRPADALERLAAASEPAGDPQHSAAELARGKYSEALLGAIDDALSLKLEPRPQDMAQFKARLHGETAPQVSHRASARTHDDVLFGTRPTPSAAQPGQPPASAAPSGTPAPQATVPAAAAPGARTEQVRTERARTAQAPAADAAVASQQPPHEASTQAPQTPASLADDLEFDAGVSLAAKAAPLAKAASAVASRFSAATLKRALVDKPAAALKQGMERAAQLWRTRLTPQFARAGSSIAAGGRAAVSAAGALLRKSLDACRAGVGLASRAAQRGRAKLPLPYARGAQATRADASPAQARWSQVIRQRVTRLERAAGMSAARLAGVVVAGIATVTLVAVLASGWLPGAGEDGGAQATAATTLVTTPGAAERHYARAARLMQEAAQARARGDVTQARYLAETALNIRPGYAEAQAFLSTL